MIKLNCKRCNKEIKALRGTKKYCDECKRIVVKETARDFAKRHTKGTKRKYHKHKELKEQVTTPTPSKAYTLIIIDGQGKAQTYKAIEQ